MKKDKLKDLFPDHTEIFDIFYIDFNNGKIYDKKFWDKGYKKEVGRPTTDKAYRRVSVTKNKKSTDVLAHRLIYYAHHGVLPVSIDHIKNIKNKDSIFNLRASNGKLNRLKEEKSKRKKKTKKSRSSEKYVGIIKRYGYWWAFYNGNFLNENGFISEELAVDCRNQFLVKEYGDYAKENIVEIPSLVVEEHRKLQDLEQQKEIYIQKHAYIKAKKEIENDLKIKSNHQS